MISVHYVSCEVTDPTFLNISSPKGCGEYCLMLFSGPINVTTDDVTQPVEAGTCIIFRPGTPQNISPLHDSVLNAVYFSMPEEEYEAYHLNSDAIFRPQNPDRILRNLQRIEREFYTKMPFWEDRADTYVRQTLIEFARIRRAEELEANHDRPMYNLFCQARNMMLINCEKEWSSTNMCEMVSLSRSQFYKYYVDYFGISPIQDLNNARIEKAMNLLTNKKFQVTDVAKLCGYASIHHFSRTFKEHTGLSPLAYLKALARGERPTLIQPPPEEDASSGNDPDTPTALTLS